MIVGERDRYIVHEKERDIVRVNEPDREKHRDSK